MNSRLNLKELSDYLAAGSPPFGTLFGTCYDPNYGRDLGKAFPAVWVRAQRFFQSEDRSSSSLMTILVRVEVAFTMVVARLIDGDVPGAAETRLNALHNYVTNRMSNYNPTGSFTSFLPVTSRDGAANETLLSADLVMSATMIYRSP